MGSGTRGDVSHRLERHSLLLFGGGAGVVAECDVACDRGGPKQGQSRRKRRDRNGDVARDVNHPGAGIMISDTGTCRWKRGDTGLAAILVIGYLAIVSLLAATFLTALNRNITRATSRRDTRSV